MSIQARKTIQSIASRYPDWLNPFPLIGKISETRYWAYLMILPGLLLISVVVFYPVINGIRLSFHSYNLLRLNQGQPFVGFEQYQKLLDGPYLLDFVEEHIHIWCGECGDAIHSGHDCGTRVKSNHTGTGSFSHDIADAVVHAIGSSRAYVGIAVGAHGWVLSTIFWCALAYLKVIMRGLQTRPLL